MEFAANFLKERHLALMQEAGYDDFRIEFKRQRTLLQLANGVKKAWQLAERAR